MKYIRHRLNARKALEDLHVLRELADGRPRFVYEDLRPATKMRSGRLYPTLQRLFAEGSVLDSYVGEGKLWRRQYRISERGLLRIGSCCGEVSEVDHAEPPVIAAYETMDVYVRKLNVFTGGLRTEEVAPGVVLDWWQNGAGEWQLAGVEVLTVKGVEIDGIREVRPTIRKRGQL